MLKKTFLNIDLDIDVNKQVSNYSRHALPIKAFSLTPYFLIDNLVAFSKLSREMSIKFIENEYNLFKNIVVFSVFYASKPELINNRSIRSDLIKVIFKIIYVNNFENRNDACKFSLKQFQISQRN